MVERGQEASYAPFGRQHRVLAETVFVRCVVGFEFEGKVEAAGANELHERLDAWGDYALLPPRHDRAIAPGSICELCLGESCSQSRLADESGATHLVEFTERLDRALRCRYASRC